jgi:hypothetical protein
MKTSLLLFALLIQSLHAGDSKAFAGNETAIPLDQLGATAQKQYSGDGISITSTANGARLRAAFQQMEGEVTREGLLLKSTVETQAGEESFSVRAIRVGRDQGNADTHVHLAESGTVEVAADVVRYIRSGLVEEYRVSMDGVRQDFIVPVRPSGEGDLGVALHISGAEVEAASYGARLTLHGSGRQIAYSRLRVTDATGRTLTARMEAAAGDRLVIRVNDVGAIYPVRIDPTLSDADWVSMGSLVGTDGQVHAIVIDGAGRVYIGGDFTAVDDKPANRVAMWDGSQWSALGQGTDHEVRALAFWGTDLIAAGEFDMAGGAAAHRIARWDGTAWHPLGNGLHGSVNALCAMPDGLYAGGAFLSAGDDMPASKIARWNGTEWSAVGGGMNQYGFVSALAASGGVLYAGGQFSTAGGVTVNNIARWNGTSWSALGQGLTGGYPGSSVDALAITSSRVYAAGRFQTAGITSANNIAQWDGTSWAPMGNGVGGALALTVSNNSLCVCSSLPITVGGGGNTPVRLLRWTGTAWQQLGADFSSNVVRALASHGSAIYAGGQFAIGERAMGHLARWDGTAWSPMGSGVGGKGGDGTDLPLYTALAVNGTDLYVAGDFENHGLVGYQKIARWNGNAWTFLPGQFSRPIHVIAFSGSDLYAGFEAGNMGNCIARFDGTTWHPLGTGMETNEGGFATPRVYALAFSGTDVYAGGHFTSAGGVSARCVARWNGSAWSGLGTGISGSAGATDVYALAMTPSGLYAGGRFNSAGDVPAYGIARWNGSAWSALGEGQGGGLTTSANDGVIVNAMLASGTDLYVGGQITSADGEYTGAVARWDGTAWHALGQGTPSQYDYATTMAMVGSRLYVGGYFGFPHGHSSIYSSPIAIWDGTDWSLVNSPLTHGGQSAIDRTMIAVGSSIYVIGGLSMAGNIVSPGIVHLESTSVVPPVVTAISPTSGSNQGGTSVTITGTGFYGASGVTIGGTAAAYVNVVNDTTITCETPLGSAGSASVLVTTPGGTSAANSFFTYLPPAPAVSSISPPSGRTSGGTSVTITGTNLTGATSVTFGGTAATNVSVVNSTTITCTTPARTAGTVSVLITTPGGTNAANTLYTYVSPPTVTAVSPATGSIAGGTSVTITGENFAGATGVTVGGAAATNLSVVNGTTIICTTPAGNAGSASVLVTTSAGTNVANTLFSYVVPVGLPAALDTPELIYTLGGNSNWFGQTAITHDSVDAAQSGVIGHSQQTWFETSVTGAGNLSFWWKVSSEAGYDYLEFYIDGELQAGEISGNVDWAQKSYTLGAGSHTLRWLYMKDNSDSSGSDAGWVDEVVWTSSPVPTVTAISPNTGSTEGGTSVTLTGTDFTGATSVTIGGAAATNISVVNSTTITCTTPAQPAGSASVLVTTAGGTNAANTLYTYQLPIPVVNETFPDNGLPAGGNTVNIGGRNFTGASSVTFGGTAATNVSVLSDQIISCTAPAHAAGTVSVLVTTPNGTSAANSLYTYVIPIPTVFAISPNTGSTAGGAIVTITGTFFTGITGVTIGGVAATDVGLVSPTTLFCTTPAHAAGVASVRVTNIHGSNAANTLYTYVTPPTVTAVSPAIGSTAGGTSVTLTGTNFTGATGVTFGGTAATSVIVVNSSTITCTIPAHVAGAVSVLVTNAVGTNAANTLFTYVIPAPDIAVAQGGPLTDGIGSVSLGSLPVGSSSGPLTFTITNSGTAELTGLSVTKPKNGNGSQRAWMPCRVAARVIKGRFVTGG